MNLEKTSRTIFIIGSASLSPRCNGDDTCRLPRHPGRRSTRYCATTAGFHLQRAMEANARMAERRPAGAGKSGDATLSVRQKSRYLNPWPRPPTIFYYDNMESGQRMDDRRLHRQRHLAPNDTRCQLGHAQLVAWCPARAELCHRRPDQRRGHHPVDQPRRCGVAPHPPLHRELLHRTGMGLLHGGRLHRWRHQLDSAARAVRDRAERLHRGVAAYHARSLGLRRRDDQHPLLLRHRRFAL